MLEVIQPVLNGLSLNQSIGRLLSSYTRAINKQKNRTGSLFQQHTKAICISKPPKLIPAWYQQAGITVITPTNIAKEYPFACMKYIHDNPVVDGYVRKPEDWRYSSFREYYGAVDHDLTNIEKGMYYYIEVKS